MIKISGGNKPCKDIFTDSLIFAANHRLEDYLIKKWKKKYKYLVSQRGLLDFFAFRLAEGIGVKESIKLLGDSELEAPDYIFYLECDVKTALSRIKKDDKYETSNFLKKLKKAFREILNEIEKKKLDIFSKTRVIRIDSTKSKKEIEKDITTILKKDIIRNG